MREDAAIRVHFAGSGDAFGSGGRWQTCIHLTGGGQSMLVDCGATSLTAHLPELGARRIVLTHMSAGMLGRLARIPAACDGMTIDL